MSRSDRVSTRPMCFGRYARDERADRGCPTCKSGIDCIPPQEETTMAGDIKWMEIPYQGDPDNETLRSVPVSISKYHREIKPGVWVDFYDIARAFDIRNPALQHLVKKALAPGQRGHKDLIQDLDDIVASAIRARELEQ